MSSLAHSLVSWPEFQRLPERPESGQRFELHDGEVIVVPPARPIHIKLQKRIEKLLESIAGAWGIVTIEFPYRPQPNLQFWVADVACIRQSDWDAMPPDEYRIFAPQIIVEILSPSNSPAKTNRQRIVALSSGTEEFWVVDPSARTVTVTNATGTTEFQDNAIIEIPTLGASLPSQAIFA